MYAMPYNCVLVLLALLSRLGGCTALVRTSPGTVKDDEHHIPSFRSDGSCKFTPSGGGQPISVSMEVPHTFAKFMEGSFLPYYEQIKSAVECQGMSFEKGVHTRWAFHGTDAIDAIVSNPVSGFQPLASGTRAGSLWGPGSYFARDAKYVARSGFAPTQFDGTKRMLLCLLTIGLPCLGDPENHGVLPVRCSQHHYHSTVDSMSNPEIHIIQNPAAAYPAYVITFL